MLDRYNIYVLALGHVFHLVWGTEEINDWIFGFMGALGVELLVWEILGNSDFVMKRIRDDESCPSSTLGTPGYRELTYSEILMSRRLREKCSLRPLILRTGILHQRRLPLPGDDLAQWRLDSGVRGKG